VNLGETLAPLGERPFRYLFLGRTTSMIGGSFATVALAFAVLDLTGSTFDVGFVLTARSIPQIVFLLIGGIWGDRLPRNLVMVGSNIVSGLSQAAVAVLLLTGEAEIWHLIILAAVNGVSSAFFQPAAIGIVPQTVPKRLLQSANAVLSLGANASSIGGLALGAVVVAATSPAVGIAVDAGSFFLAALFLALVRIPRALRMEASNFIGELVDGWREFISRRWLWAIVAQFGFCNAISLGTEAVLGPAIADDQPWGRFGWGTVLTADSLGLVVGGVILLHVRPRRLLLTATLGYLLTIPFLLGLAGPAPLLVLIALALVAGIGVETFSILWETTFQQEIPEEKLSRIGSYDALGSFALIPVGVAIAGPAAELFGTREWIIAATAINVTATLAVLLVHDVRTITRRED